MCKDAILNLFLDNIAVPCDTVKDLVDKADANNDGLVTLREFYEVYRRWKE